MGDPVDFTQVEDAIIAELKAKMPYLKKVESYAGQLAGDIDKLITHFPAAYVLYGGSEYAWVDGPVHNDKPGFTVIVVSKNLRGNEAQRKDENGCYDMIKDVLEHLTNQAFGLEIEKFKPLGTSLLVSTQLSTAYNINFETNFDVTFSW